MNKIYDALPGHVNGEINKSDCENPEYYRDDLRTGKGLPEPGKDEGHHQGGY